MNTGTFDLVSREPSPRRMSPPRRLDSMALLCYADLEPGCRRTGRCLHYGAGTGGEGVRALAICKAPVGVALFGCGSGWKTLTRTFHPSARSAKYQADLEYAGLDGKWTPAPGLSEVERNLLEPLHQDGEREEESATPTSSWELVLEGGGNRGVDRSASVSKRSARLAIIGHFRRWAWGQFPDEAYLAAALSRCGAEVYCLEQDEALHVIPPVDWVVFTGNPGSHVHLPGIARFFRTVLWTLDWLPDFKERSPIVDSAAKATLFVSSDRFDWTSFGKLSNHRYLPAACESVRVPYSPRPLLSCAFLGSLYSPRRKEIAEIVRSFGGEVRGSREGWLFGRELARFVQGTRVIVGDNVRNDVPGYWSSRNYIIPGLGGFLLTPRVPLIEEQFKIGRHLAVYESPEDLHCALTYWLGHEEERERIRRAGYLHVHRKHSWDIRARALFQMLGEEPKVTSRRTCLSFHCVEGLRGVKPLHLVTRARHRLAIVGWANDSGVGREFTDAISHLPVAAAFVLYNASKPTKHGLLAKVPHVLAREGPLDPQMEDFIARYKPDTILTWEVPGSWSFPALWKRRGIRWVSVAHWDWFAVEHQKLWRHADLIAPNEMCRDGLAKLGLHSTILPVPVDTARFPFRPRSRASRFVSVYGFGGIGDRRGLPELGDAWSRCASAAPSLPALVLRAQKVPSELTDTHRQFVHVRVGNTTDPADLFEDADVAVQPSRFEGVGLTLLEAQACGLPVITVDAEPMRTLAPDLLAAIGQRASVSIMGKPVVSTIADVQALADRIGSLFGRDISELSHAARKRVEELYSWDALRTSWIDVLRGTSF